MADADKRKFRILIPEDLGEDGLKILRDASDVEADIRTGLSVDELHKVLPDYDAIITRSGTKMNAEAIAAGTRLRVIARAGVGVDNVDIQEASKRGIIVINAPTGNTLAATEHTIALMLSAMRMIPYAHASLKEGKWERKRFIGHQLNGRKLLVIGLGPIGSGVATRCRAFGMEIMGFDPFVSEKRMHELGIKKVTDLLGSLSLADVVTLHVPSTKETRGMIGEKALRAIKHGAYIVNCARGGLVDEAACAEALRDGRLAGAAFDVFDSEPPTESPLFADDLVDKVILTPHLGASTVEAQGAVAEIAITNTLAALRGEEYKHAVNLPFMEQNLNYKQKNYLRLARKMGILAGKLLENDNAPATTCKVTLRGPFLADDETPGNRKRPYTIAAIKGLLEVASGPDVSYMTAPIIASERGISIEEATAEPHTYRNLIDVEVEGAGASVRLSGTITEEGRQHIVRVNEYQIDFSPFGKTLIFQNHDRPGVIGKLGNLLGDGRINIANFSLGRKNESGLALAVMEIDGDIPNDVMDAIKNDSDMIWAMTVEFDTVPPELPHREGDAR